LSKANKYIADNYILGKNGLPSNRNNDESVDHTSKSEITDVNPYTNTTEFHGGSSSVAILSHVQSSCGKIQDWRSTDKESPSLITSLHNPGFSHQAPSLFTLNYSAVECNFYTDQAVIFMEGYFDSLHYIHPIIDKENFVSRARNLWLGHSTSPSFIALYFSVLSLGALIRLWEEDRLLGMTRFEWSQKLFHDAQARLDEAKFANDLDTVQCLFLMVRVSIISMLKLITS
jgi:hypothetical protein